jgi:DNA-binding PadR family transcriptional regulator
MAKRRTVNNLLAVAVLSYLTERPMHPYELGQTLRQRDDARSIKYNHGSLYTVVRQLASAGYVEPVETTRDTKRPERTVYAITDAGRGELRDWMHELIAEPEHEYLHFVAALSLIAGLRPEVVVQLLRSRLDRLGAQRAEIQAGIDRNQAQGHHPLFLVEEDYRLALLDAEAAFVRRFIDHITDPDTGWGPPWAQIHDERDNARASEPTTKATKGRPR